MVQRTAILYQRERERERERERTSFVIKSHSKKYEDFHALVTAANQRKAVWAS